MPDQETTTEPPKRMTTAEAAKTAQEAAQNASAALRVAQSADDMVAAMSEKITDLATRFDEMRNATPSAATALETLDLTAFVTRDMVDSRIHEGLGPLHQEVHELRQKGTLTPESKGSLSGVLARLEDAERKVAGIDAAGITTQVAQELHPTLTELRRRLSALEEEVKSHGDPVSATLAEDALADQVQAAVERALTDLSTTSDVSVARVDQLVREFADLRQHVETHGTHVTRALVNEVAAQVGPTTGGTGAATKVLQLMRNVTHIGKEKEANLGKGGRFKFRGVDDAMDAVGHAMRDVGLVLSTEVLNRETTLTPVTQQGTDNGQKWERTVVWATSVVTVRYTFTDPEDGSTHVFEMVGEGRDSSDKSTSKATSMALKYGLFQALMIPVTGLDDADDAPPQQMMAQRPADHQEQQPTRSQPDAQQAPPTEEQRAHRAGEALAAIRNLHHVPRAEQYDRLVQIMNRIKQEGLLEFALEGSTLNQHGLAVMATLRQPAEQPPTGETDHRASYEPPADEGEYR